MRDFMVFHRLIPLTLGRRSKARTLWLTLIALTSVSSVWAASTDQLWSHWSTHDGQSTLSVDHQVWQTLLSRHVVASDDGINRVAYKDFDESSKTLLNQYLTRLSEVQPTRLNQTEQAGLLDQSV